MYKPTYVLMTSAHNEEIYLKATIEAVLGQTILPKKWVIVSDHSVDGTDELIQEYSSKYSSFITYVRKDSIQKGFISKVVSLNLAYDLLKNEEFMYIGNLDADITIDNNYFESLMTVFEKEDKLGISGGFIWEIREGKKFKHIISNTSVPGAIQFFRKQCYVDTGGYYPLPYGGEDSVSEITARMKGWTVKTMQALPVYHHRQVGHVDKNIVKISLNRGKRFYFIGYSIQFEIARCFYRVFVPPYFLSALFEFIGYFSQYVRGTEIKLPPGLLQYLRNEQNKRLKSLFYSPSSFYRKYVNNNF